MLFFTCLFINAAVLELRVSQRLHREKNHLPTKYVSDINSLRLRPTFVQKIISREEPHRTF